MYFIDARINRLINYFQEIADKIERHKDIIDQNNKSFYDMKKQKDGLQNERK